MTASKISLRSKFKVEKYRFMKNSTTLIFTINSKVWSFHNFQPIWKVCTFLVRSYEQPKKFPGVGAEFDANPGVAILKFWIAFGSRSGNCQYASPGVAIPKIQVQILYNLGHFEPIYGRFPLIRYLSQLRRFGIRQDQS